MHLDSWIIKIMKAFNIFTTHINYVVCPSASASASTSCDDVDVKESTLLLSHRHLLTLRAGDDLLHSLRFIHKLKKIKNMERRNNNSSEDDDETL